MITKEMVKSWVGSDNLQPDSFLDLLVEIANGQYPAKEFSKDVSDYQDENITINEYEFTEDGKRY